MTEELTAFLVALFLMLAINYLWIYKKSPVVGSLVLMFTGMFMVFSSIAGTDIDKYFIFPAVLTIATSMWLGVKAWTKRGFK